MTVERFFTNVWTNEGSASGAVTFNLPWPSQQVTFSNDTSGVNMELYLMGSAGISGRRMTMAGGETVSFDFRTKQIAISAAGAGNAYRLWVLG